MKALRRRRRETAAATVRVRPVATTLPASVEAALSAPGEPLDVALRGEMERRLGHDFGDVRVHVDARAAAAARTLDADAFTCGADIVFGAGRYRPGAEDGQWLIAHELVHTLQQGRCAAAAALQVSLLSVPDADPLEREAADVAGRIAAGEPVPPGTVTIAAPAARGRIARQARAALEQIPAEVPDSPEAVRALAGDIARLLLFDPGDQFGRVKRRLARLAPATRAAVATELGGRIPAIAATRLREILAELLPPGASALATEPPEPFAAAEPAEPSAAEPAEPSAVGDEALAAAAEPSTVGDEALAAAAEPSPAEIEPAAPGELPEPVAESEGPVAEPELQGEVVAAEPEAASVVVKEREEDRRAQAGGPAPAPETAEAAGPEEDAADSAPGDETEEEALEAHDEAEAEDVDHAPDVADGAEAPEAVAEDAAALESDGAEDAGPVAAPAPAEAPGTSAEAAPEGGESASTESESEGEPADPDPAPDEEEGVVEPPAAEMADEDDAVATEPAAELEGAEEIETGAEEPEEPADAQLAEEETTSDEEAPVDVGGDVGGAAPIEELAEPETPDLSEADPAAAMDAVGTLPPAQSEAALTGVDAASSRSVGAQRSALVEQPPELDKPTGAPTAEELAAESDEGAEPPEAPERLQRVPEPPALAPTRVALLPPAPPPVAGRVAAPQISGGAQGELSEDGRRTLQASLGALPVHDPALDISAGPAPAVTLEGAVDPQRAYEERARLESAARSALADGRRAIVKPAGKQHLVPDAPPERLTAAITPAAPAPPPAAPTAGATMAAADPASIIARQQRGAQLRAAAKDAAAGMRTRRAEQAATAAAERRRSQEQITQLVRDSAVQQAERRADARGEVHDQRQRWSAAEHELADGKLTEADTKLKSGVEEVARLKTEADEKAATHIESGERDAEQARRDGEEKAAAERKRGQEKSSGPLGWLADQATALFDEIKAGITKVFEIARAAVREAIEQAKKLAAAAIDFARDAIVAAIRLTADALIAIGDKLLAGFPGVRDRFRRAIEERVARAQAAVNALAEGLKNVVQKALDGLGAALDAALGLLEKGLLLMVEAYRAVVAGALKWADGLVRAFGAFALLVKHVAANPKQWLTNLAASAKDGVKNHLWKAFKAAIKRWFWEKVEEVLGLGLTIWNLLKKGGLSLARIGTMAWEAIKTAIPPTLIQILIEKLISLLIPAAAAVMLIIETLQAAWGTIQRVLEAFERFFAFLKAVRTGRAGPQFATAIAAAAIAVIDFVANWLLKRLRKPAGKIAKKLREIAKKLGKKLAKLAKKIGKKLFGKRKKPKKLKGKRSKKPKPDKRAKAERRVKAATEFLGRQLSRERSRTVLWAQMQYARLRWRVRVRLKERGEEASLAAEANPRIVLKLAANYPKGGPDIDDYRGRAAAFQGFLRRRHEIHHVLPVARRDLWDATGIDWNHEDILLEVPRSLHKAMHRPYYEVDAVRAARVTQEAQDELTDSWNVEWGRWLLPKLKAIGIGSPTALRKSGAAAKSAARSLISRGKNHVVALFSALLGVNLWRFRLRQGMGQKIAKRFASKLAALEKILKTVRLKKPQRQTAILNWKARHVPRVMSGKKARKLLRFIKTGKR
jgi:Domain of unknown function (DUF4157)